MTYSRIVFIVVRFSQSVVKNVCSPSTFQLTRILFLRCANFVVVYKHQARILQVLSYYWATRMFSGAYWSFARFPDITVQSEHSGHQPGCHNAHDTYRDITPLAQH